MIGTGGLKQELEKQIEVTGVENNIRLLGNMPNSQVLSLMQQHHIFIFTSDYGEGWGAVLNEAMSNGCAVVCSDKVGASRFLIKDGWNGLLFKSGSDKDLYIKVRRYIDDRLLLKSCALNAYKTMSTIWSPKNAALNFLSLCNSLLTNSPVTIEEGPCSIAKMIW
jgi:glycosyltransferase involved in cell wall biosynthesis